MLFLTWLDVRCGGGTIFALSFQQTRECRINKRDAVLKWKERTGSGGIGVLSSSCFWTCSSVAAETMSVEKGGRAGVAGVGSVMGGGGGVSRGSESGFGCFWKTDSMGESSRKNAVKSAKGVKGVTRGEVMGGES